MGKHEHSLGFNHPRYSGKSPSRQEWPEKFPTGKHYRWRFIFDVGDTKDTSGLLLKYFPNSDSYRIIFGKTYDGIDKETSDLNYILNLFESCIKNYVIGSRPIKN